MKILIVAATVEEIKPLIQKLSGTKKFTGSVQFCKYKNLHIDILISGTGMVSTAYACTKALLKPYDFALNVGVAGSFKKNIKIGDVVNVACDKFSELGAEDGQKFLSLKEMNIKGENEFKNNTPIRASHVMRALKKVSGITVNTVHGNALSIKNIIQRLNPDIETMEGAAFMFVCEREKTPYLQIRAISNYVERRNKKNWNLPLAIKNLNEKVVEILDGLTNYELPTNVLITNYLRRNKK